MRKPPLLEPRPYLCRCGAKVCNHLSYLISPATSHIYQMEASKSYSNLHRFFRSHFPKLATIHQICVFFVLFSGIDNNMKYKKFRLKSASTTYKSTFVMRISVNGNVGRQRELQEYGGLLFLIVRK